MYFFYRKDYYVCIMGEHVVITSNPNSHFTNSKDMNDINKRYLYKEGQKQRESLLWLKHNQKLILAEPNLSL